MQSLEIHFFYLKKKFIELLAKAVSFSNFVKKNIDIIESNYIRYPNRNMWNCNCHVIHDNDFDVNQIDFNFLREKYERVVDDFCKYKKLKLKK